MIRPTQLRKGERVRFVPGGQLYEVDRVTVCAAYLHKVFDPPVYRVFTDKAGEEQRIKVSRGPVEPGISPCAFVYREEAEAEVMECSGMTTQEHPGPHSEFCPLRSGVKRGVEG